MGTREEEDAPLPIEGVVDHRRQPIFSLSAAGGWPSAVFIIGVHRLRRRQRQRVERGVHDAPHPRWIHRRLLPRALPRRRRILLSVRPGPGDAGRFGGGAVNPAARVRRRQPAELLPLPIPDYVLLLRVVPGGCRAGWPQALRSGLRGRPVRRRRPRRVQVQELLLQLDVLRRQRRHSVHGAADVLRPGQHRLGTRIWAAVCFHGDLLRLLLGRNQNPLAQLAGADGTFSSSRRSTPREEAKEALLHGGSAEEEGVAEGSRGVLRLLPIWATSLLFAVLLAQPSTFFTKQGSTMDRRITPSFLVPPAGLQSFINLSAVTFVPIYDRLFVPITRTFTGRPSGLTTLQRIGVGMAFSISAMVIAAQVETKRLQTARDFGLVDLPGATIPMSLWWLVPQYVILGVSSVFTLVGLQEFFYDQVPVAMRSLGLALYLSIIGVGSFISGLLILVIQKASVWWGEDWFSDNLNRAPLDYFYWLLAALSSVELLLYLYFAHSFVYKQRKKGSGPA